MEVAQHQEGMQWDRKWGIEKVDRNVLDGCVYTRTLHTEDTGGLRDRVVTWEKVLDPSERHFIVP